MGIIKKGFKAIKKLLFDDFIKANFIYTKYYEKLEVSEDTMIFQSFDGTSISGNVYYMLQETSQDTFYSAYKKYVVCDKKSYHNIEELLEKKSINNVELIKIHSRKYCKLLASAKYLINNSTFPSYFIKKDGQIYINTWHGTPLKMMGRNIKSAPQELGNTQRNFFMADYLLYQNEFMFEKMRKDYMLDNLYQGEYLLSGYPRNDIFYNEESRNCIREKLGIQGKKVIIYMPTWRGTLQEKEDIEQCNFIEDLLMKIDRSLNENTVMYVKLHNYVNTMLDFKKFKNIQKFPKDYETYEFLNIADILITDYSSVFFDFANTGRKIILFAYDKEEYLKDRGMYLEYDKLPFKIVENVEDLMKAIDNQTKQEYSEFQEEFCNYDSINATRNVCNYIFKKEKSEEIKVIQGTDFCNHKENVLIFGGALLRNGITTALKGIFKNVDLTKRNYILTVFSKKVAKNKEELNFFKDNDYIVIQGRRNTTISEYIASILYFYFNINTNYIKQKVNYIFARELKRVYPNIRIDHAIHFTGYEKNVMHLFRVSDAKKTIFVHNDLAKELKTKSNIHKNSLLEAYKKYDNIVLIRESLREEMKPLIAEEDYKKVKLVHNFNNIEVILKRKDEKIEFLENTYSNTSIEKLNEILNEPKFKKFINIARFSKEKGLDRLIKSFNMVYEKNPDVYLIIIGGYGKQFEEIQALVEKAPNNHIVLIQNLPNPYPVLNKADCFILSSYYEGLPMTIMEALILEKKVISTDIQGPKEFLSQGYGYLVENSEEGLIKGMNDFLENKLKDLKKFDAKEFNDNALKEFEELFK